MKRRLFFTAIITLAFLTSCSVSNNVVGDWGIQKRKYNDGFYISFGNKFKNQGETLKTETGSAGDDLAMENQDQPSDKVENEPAPAMDQHPEEQAVTVPEPVEVGPSGIEPESVNTGKTSGTAEPANFTRTPRDRSGFLNRTGRFYKPVILQTTVPSAAQATNDTVLLILLIILCFILPPVSVAVVDGISTRFWIDLILFLIGIGVGWWLFGGGLAYICLLVSVIYALLIVLAVI